MIPEGTDFSLYFVTDTALAGGPDRLPHVVFEAVAGGAGVVQVRDKQASGPEFRALALACWDAVRRAEETLGARAALVVNDRVDIAADLGLHVHVGQSDTAVAQARAALGEDLMVGISASLPQEVRDAAATGLADLVGIGPVWATPTKPDAAAPLGPEGLRHCAGIAREHGLASVAIGGIDATTAPSLAGAPVDGICVVSAVAAAQNPRAAARELRELSHRNQGTALPAPHASLPTPHSSPERIS